VARYNIQMARWWVQSEPRWKQVLGGGIGSNSQPRGRNCSEQPTSCELRVGSAASGEAYWGEAWQAWPEGYWAAWNKWINGSIGDDVSVPACPSGLVYNWKK
jgi:hypothetical protein